MSVSPALIVTLCFVLAVYSQTCDVPSACSTNGISMTCQTGNFNVQQTVKSSSYKYNLISDPGTSYQFQFSQIFEVTEVQNIPVTDFQSLSCSFSGVPEVIDLSENCTNLETTFKSVCTNGPNFSAFTLLNHFSMDDSSTSLKFDIIIDNYVWKDNSSVSLGISFTYTSPSGNASFVNFESYHAGDSYFEITPTALDTPTDLNQEVPVALTNDFSILYGKFSEGGTLVHDPTIGITTSAAPPPTEPGDDDGDWLGLDWWIWVLIGVGAVLLIIVLIAVGVFFFWRWKRRHGYMTVSIGHEGSYA